MYMDHCNKDSSLKKVPYERSSIPDDLSKRRMRKQFRKLWIKPSGLRVVGIANWERELGRDEN
jgi:hypothetical protein